MESLRCLRDGEFEVLERWSDGEIERLRDGQLEDRLCNLSNTQPLHLSNLCPTLRLAIERHSRAHKRHKRGFVECIALMKIDGAARAALKAEAEKHVFQAPAMKNSITVTTSPLTTAKRFLVESKAIGGGIRSGFRPQIILPSCRPESSLSHM